MGLLKLLPSSPYGLKGLTPPTIGSANPQSKLHYEYSINNTPPFPGFPNPSQLDLEGKTPPKYLDNPPG
jgi:hypothetical protein